MHATLRGRFCLVSTQVLHLEVRGVSRDGEDTHRVGVAQAALPALNGDDRRSGLQQVQREGATETKPDTVVDL